MIPHLKLFTPGPVEVSPKTLAAFSRPMIGHRGSEFFALSQRRGKLRPGIYERIETAFGSAVRSVLLFTKRATYRPRYDIFRLAQRQWDTLMPFHFSRELQKALQTSMHRGRA